MTNEDVGGVASTEVCNISCVMCHFNGPKAPRKQGQLTVDEVRQFLSQVPRGRIWLAATGELFVDPNAITHIRTAVSLGFQPCILTNGTLMTPALIDELLTIGVRTIRFSVDEISAKRFAKIRVGGDLQVILDACAYLRAKKQQYPDLHVGINVTLFHKTFPRQDEFIEFWTGKVDQVNFNAEYFDVWKFRNLFFTPEKRNDCHIQVYLLPTGQMAPCCAMQVHQHQHDVEWLPHIKDMSPTAAHELFKKWYKDPSSPLGQVCKNCDWWVMWARDTEGRTPYPGQTAYLRCVSLPDDDVTPSATPQGLFGGRLSLPVIGGNRQNPVASGKDSESAPAVARSSRLRSLVKRFIPAKVRIWLRKSGLVPPPRK